MHLATPSQFTGLPLKLKEINISTKHNRLREQEFVLNMYANTIKAIAFCLSFLNPEDEC